MAGLGFKLGLSYTGLYHEHYHIELEVKGWQSVDLAYIVYCRAHSACEKRSGVKPPENFEVFLVPMIESGSNFDLKCGSS